MAGSTSIRGIFAWGIHCWRLNWLILKWEIKVHKAKQVFGRHESDSFAPNFDLFMALARTSSSKTRTNLACTRCIQVSVNICLVGNLYIYIENKWGIIGEGGEGEVVEARE